MLDQHADARGWWGLGGVDTSVASLVINKRQPSSDNKKKSRNKATDDDVAMTSAQRKNIKHTKNISNE